MSKLSPALKALIDAPFAHAKTLPAPSNITSVYQKIAKHAEIKKVEKPTWVTMAVGSALQCSLEFY